MQTEEFSEFFKSNLIEAYELNKLKKLKTKEEMYWVYVEHSITLKKYNIMMKQKNLLRVWKFRLNESLTEEQTKEIGARHWYKPVPS